MIVVFVLLLAVLLPIVVSLSYFKDAPGTSTGNPQIQTATESAMPVLASDTPRPAQPTKTVRSAPPAQGSNCTYPADHWLVSAENWPAEITIGNLYYTQEQAIEFTTAQPGEVFNILFIQLHAAYLNILSGATQSQVVEPMIEAGDWVNKALYGSDIVKHGQARGLELAKTLQAYNDGETGPGRCGDYTSPLRLFSTNISAAVLSLTPATSLEATQANDIVANTPTAVLRTPSSSHTTQLPFVSRTPTRNPDSQPPSIPPTKAPTVQPTATQVPPTPRPTSPPPTNTLRPAEPTPTSAPPEEPTPTSPPI
jgi:hypothetical protein